MNTKPYNLNANHIERWQCKRCCLREITLKPKFYLLRHVTTQQARRVVRIVTWRVVRAALCLFQHGGWRKSSSARVSKTISCFIIIYYFSSQMKLNSFI